MNTELSLIFSRHKIPENSQEKSTKLVTFAANVNNFVRLLKVEVETVESNKKLPGVVEQVRGTLQQANIACASSRIRFAISLI